MMIRRGCLSLTRSHRYHFTIKPVSTSSQGLSSRLPTFRTARNTNKPLRVTHYNDSLTRYFSSSPNIKDDVRDNIDPREVLNQTFTADIAFLSSSFGFLSG
eukprot:TRINITY_DN217_c0_g1_i3.p1 TRINITY_DN217_c0_g1~~TRINITY_DN217_c0_g1_i3.p1  ORF type:complete len:101 (-),score=7.44 TRINITY_DN217_c0_g1_i3:314-616(-)